MKIAAVIVTYNRKELLMECLKAIYMQDIFVDKVVLIDNASKDGTYQYLVDYGYAQKENFEYKRMDTNLGGAGGFYHGMEYASKLGVDWLWIMDDDTIPDTCCLRKLLEARKEIEEPVSFLASCVEGVNNEPMNVPKLDERPTENGYSDWYRLLYLKMVRIERATFVSLLVNVDAIRKCGLPCKEYFIWGDDSEYTLRLTRNYGNAYLVGDSKVCHKRAVAKELTIKDERDINRINNFYFLYRNRLMNNMLYNGKKSAVMLISHNLVEALRVLKYSFGIKKSIIILKGTWAGVTQCKYFKKYINSQLGNQ